MISTENKISIKKAIEKHPLVAAQLKPRYVKEDVIDNFAQLCKLDAVFIKFNLQTIRNWI